MRSSRNAPVLAQLLPFLQVKGEQESPGLALQGVLIAGSSSWNPESLGKPRQLHVECMENAQILLSWGFSHRKPRNVGAVPL